MIPVSAEFNDAQNADSAQYTAIVNIVLGDYASRGTIISSGDDPSGNYPAAGVIDGDRTEINIGAAATADNGIGKSSWKANAAPDGFGNTYLSFFLPVGTRFNRIKLYNKSGDPLTSYEFHFKGVGPGGGFDIVFAGTPDRYLPPGAMDQGFGSGGFGDGPFGGTGQAWPGAGYTGQIDVYDFPEITTLTSRHIELIIYATQSGNAPQVVAVEMFRVIDITDKVTGFNIDRAKDLKLRNPLAAACEISCDNTDQYFSLEYAPTSVQMALHQFVNDEWPELGIDVEINEGFFTSRGIERIRTFTGNIDSIDTKSKSGTATIQCRDYMKFMIGQTDSCNIKTAIDIKDALRYVLNRNNVSDYEMDLTTTGITLDYFFTYQQAILTTMQELVQAAGDALFYFDENGKAVFQFYLSNIYNDETLSGQATWLTGAFTNSDAYSIPGSVARQWFLIDNFADGNFSVNPAWAIPRQADGAFAVVSFGGNYVLRKDWNFWRFDSYIITPSSVAYGTWHFKMWTDSPEQNNEARFFFICNYAPGYDIASNGYFLAVTRNSPGSTLVKLYSSISGAESVMASAVDGGGAPSSTDVYTVTRDATGLITVYRNGAFVLAAIDSTFSSSIYVVCESRPELSGFSGNHYWDDIWFSRDIPGILASPPTSTKARWESASIDQGASVTLAGVISALYSTPVGTSINWYTSTSPDNSTWTAWAPVTLGSPYPSPVQRYIKVAFDLNCPQDDGMHNANYATPSVSQITVAWYFGTGIPKWSQTVNFYFAYNSDIIDLEEQVTDNLGGDTAVINDVTVTSAPAILAGTNTDTQWQGTSGVPASAVSVANPLNVTAGTLNLYPVIAGGMDTTNMPGGTAIAITWGTATGTAAITKVHPTKPTLTLTVTGPGTITDLRLIGKSFQNISTPYQALASDSNSIKRRRRRTQSINNNYVMNNNIAQNIADKMLVNYKNPLVFVPAIELWPRLNLQPGDQVNVNEVLSGANTVYYVISYNRDIKVGDSGSVSMRARLVKIVA